MSILTDIQKTRRAKKHGIVHPWIALRAARAADLPYFAACALLMIESAGGNNWFGSDEGSGFRGVEMEAVLGDREVTEERYLLYKMHRDVLKPQGIGGTQLTHPSIQDEADADGGCWKPKVNYRSGFRLLKSFRQQGMDWTEAGTRYNGSPDYGVRFNQRVNEWKQILGASDERR